MSLPPRLATPYPTRPGAYLAAGGAAMKAQIAAARLRGRRSRRSNG